MALTASFDLWYLLVEVVFGNAILSWVGMSVLMLIIGAMSRMSFVLLSVILLLFSLAFFTGYLGPLFLMLAFVFAIIYFSTSVMNFISRYR